MNLTSESKTKLEVGMTLSFSYQVRTLAALVEQEYSQIEHMYEHV